MTQNTSKFKIKTSACALLFFLLTGLIDLNAASIAPRTNKETGVTKVNLTADQGYKIIKTIKLITANATKTYSTKNRKSTQYALDRKSMQEKDENHIIKISDHTILICDPSNKILKNLTVIKHWIDSAGPSTVYDLKDQNGVEYSLDYSIDINQKTFVALRYQKTIETYTDSEE